MIFVVLYKYLNCAVDQTIDTCRTTVDRNTDRRVKLLMMLLVTSWCKPLKTDPSKEICHTYAN